MATYTFTAHDVTNQGGNVNVVGSSTYTIELIDDDPQIGNPGDTGELISFNGGDPVPYTYLGIGITDVGETMIVIDVAGELYGFNVDGGELANGNTKIRFSELDSTPTVPCFTPGTLITTDQGPRLVEDLVAGDLVLTRAGTFQPLRAVLSRPVSAAEMSVAPALRPVRIAKDAFGPGCPNRDTDLSPQHRLWIADWRAQYFFGEEAVLATARSLVNDTTIRARHDCVATTYYHLVMDTHAIITANGMWTETLLLSQDFLDKQPPEVASELRHLFPDLFGVIGAQCLVAAARQLRHHEGMVAFA